MINYRVFLGGELCGVFFSFLKALMNLHLWACPGWSPRGLWTCHVTLTGKQ